MQCPHCGRNNFNWARRCDHCRQPMTGARVTAPASSSGTGSPASAVDITGRTLTFNGVSYTALSRIRQLNDADVYPLRHQQSELVVFEVKVFRCEPGTALYEDIKRRAHSSFRTKAD